MPVLIRIFCALAFVMATACHEESARQHRRPDGLEPTVLIVDVEGDGVRLQGADEGPMLKFPSGHGFRTGWTLPNSDDGFLVVEQQQNGRIDDLVELLGWQGPPNGFDYLRRLDGLASPQAKFGKALKSPDAYLDRADAVFHRLVLWRDINADGESAEEELQSAVFLGFESFSLLTQAAAGMEAGNRIIERGHARRKVNRGVIDVEVVAVRLSAR